MSELSGDAVFFVMFAVLLVVDVAVTIYVKAYKSCNPCLISVSLMLSVFFREVQLGIGIHFARPKNQG